MRQHTSGQLLTALEHSMSRRLIADVFHGTDRIMQDLPLKSWTFEGDIGGDIKHSGRATVIYNSVNGESLVPEGTKGILSPFRARLLLRMQISAGDFAEDIVLGWVRVTKVPQAYDVRADVNGREIVTTSVVELQFQSLEIDVKRRGFRFPEQPRGDATCWGEVRRITGMPVKESLPDTGVSSGLIFDASQGGRLEAVQTLIADLGGIPVIDPSGAWTAIPSSNGPVVGELKIGPQGTVTDVPYAIDTEDVYTEVVGTYEQEGRDPITAVASIELAEGLFPTYTRYRSNPLVKTQSAAEADVNSVLRGSIESQQYEVPIQCIINPLIELGDTIKVTGWVRALGGRVTKFSMSDSALMNVTIEASRELS